MDWNNLLTDDIKFMITTLILGGGLLVSIITLRRKTPKKVAAVIRKGKDADSSFALFILGGILGLIIGRNLTEGKSEE